MGNLGRALGRAGAYTTAVRIAERPEIAAEVTSDSRGGGVGVISGASTWLSADTPVGMKYGSSRDQPYMNLRPRADTATAPSMTTYTFNRPTPTMNWSFVLGGIDADRVRVHAVGPAGNDLTAAELGYNGGFNYCAPGLSGKPSCTGDPDDVPDWDPATRTLTGNAAMADTSGAAAWFEPTAPISELTLEYTNRSGFPIYQTWFASLARDLTGTVSTVSGDGSGIEITLRDGNGEVLGTTTTGPGGTYAFPGIHANLGYTVDVAPPEGMTADGPTSRPADLSDDDDVVDFALRDLAAVSVSGRVVDDTGAPIHGAVVTIPGVGEATTGLDGGYVFAEVPPGDHAATVELPDGYALLSSPGPFTVPEDSDDPITGLDFVAQALAVISGNVSAGGTGGTGGTGVPGVTLTLTGPGGEEAKTVTGPGGDYVFPDLPPGEYTVAISAPNGFEIDGEATVTVTAGGDAGSVVAVDFRLTATDVEQPATPAPSPEPPSAGTGPGTPGLSHTGSGIGPMPLVALGGVMVLAGAVVLARRRAQLRGA